MIPHLRWGILGTGNIATKFATDCGTVADRLTLRAVGSRDQAKAEAFALKHGVAKAYDSYDAVLADDQVDAVYISLLNQQHRAWAIAAARAGKHILCEKPAGMTAAEVSEMIAAAHAADVFFMEGFIYRCHPRSGLVRTLIADGAIGAVRMLHATFSFAGAQLDRPRLWTRAMGGGGIMDVGVYPLSWLRMLGGEPTAIAATAHLNADGVDEWCGGALRFPGDVVGTFTAAVNCFQPSVASVFGADGWLELPEPWRSPRELPSCILHRPGKPDESFTADDGLGGLAREALTVATYRDQREAPFFTHQDSIAQARMLDALRHQVGVWWDGER